MSTLSDTEIEADRNAREARDKSAEVADRFRRFPLNDGAIETIENVTAGFTQFVETLAGIIPQGRSASMAFTALQEAKFWANDAIAHDASSAAR